MPDFGTAAVSRARLLTAIGAAALAGWLQAPLGAAVQGRDVSASFFVDRVERGYELHVPAQIPPGGLPLVVVLHGGGDDDPVRLIKQATRFDAKADTEGFAVVYPEAIDGHWNDGRLRRDRSHAEDVDDIAFVHAVVERVASTTAIDLRRVYLVGASNGGMMAYRIACERPQFFAAVAAVVANLPVGLSCGPSRPVPMLVINGTDDPLMPWEGGKVRFGTQHLGAVLSAEATMQTWAHWNRCSGATETRTLPDQAPADRTRVTRITYSDCQADVALFRVEGGGHTWPGAGQQTVRRSAFGRTSRDIDATDEIWSFFSHTRAPLDARN